MIDRLVELIPQYLLQESGAVFYSGRAAFGDPAPLYILGLNPGGDSSDQSLSTVAEHVQKVRDMPKAEWSAFCDERWGPRRQTPGPSGMQPRVLHVLKGLGLDARRVPASNLIFCRTRTESDLGDRFERIAQDCWNFHKTVIEELGVRVILCLGQKAGGWVARQVGAHRELGRYVEQNGRGWPSVAMGNAAGRVVVIAAHPSRANWQNPSSDPTPLLSRFLSLGVVG